MHALQIAPPSPAPRFRRALPPRMTEADRVERMAVALECGDYDEVVRLDVEEEDEPTEAGRGCPTA